jgi:hypothetical protein
MTEPEMPAVKFPDRDWGDEEPAPAPVPYVLVSSRAGRGDPTEVGARNASWRSLQRAAERAGWRVRVTYALAWTADRYYLNGKIAKPAHHTHSVALRMARDGVRAVAVWWRETLMPDIPRDAWKWQFGMYGPGTKSLNSTQFKAAL